MPLRVIQSISGHSSLETPALQNSIVRIWKSIFRFATGLDFELFAKAIGGDADGGLQGCYEMLQRYLDVKDEQKKQCANMFG